MSSNPTYSSEDLLWKLGISTLFILTHQLLIRNTATGAKSPTRKGNNDHHHHLKNIEFDVAADSGSTTKASVTTNNDLSSIRPDERRGVVENDCLSALSTSDLYPSPTDALERILIDASHRIYKSPPPLSMTKQGASASQPGSGTSHASEGGGNNGVIHDPKVLYDEIMSHNISNNDPEYIQDTFQQTVRLFYEENQTLKRKIEDLQQQMTSGSGSNASSVLFSPSSLTSASQSQPLLMQQNNSSAFNSSLLFTTPFKGPLDRSQLTEQEPTPDSPSLQYLIEQNQKLTQDKQLLIQSIEFAQSQYQALNRSQSKGSAPPSAIKGEPAFAATVTPTLTEFENNLLTRIQQLLQDVPEKVPSSLTGANLLSSRSASFTTTSATTNPSDPATVASALSSQEKLLQKLTVMKQVVRQDYPTLQKQYDQLSQKYDHCMKELHEMKNQLNQFKLVKIQEVTDLHRKIVELSQFYEQQLQQQHLNQQQQLLQQQQNGANSQWSNGSRSNTPNKRRTTPNKQVISLPPSIQNIGNTSEHSKFITKELAKTYQSPQGQQLYKAMSTPDVLQYPHSASHLISSASSMTTTPRGLGSASSDRINPLSNPRRAGGGGGGVTTPSKQRKSSTSPSISSYRQSLAKVGTTTTPMTLPPHELSQMSSMSTSVDSSSPLDYAQTRKNSNQTNGTVSSTMN